MIDNFKSSLRQYKNNYNNIGKVYLWILLNKSFLASFKYKHLQNNGTGLGFA